MARINLPGISTGKAVKTVSEYYAAMRKAGTSCRDIRPIIFFGPTGVGKSSAVYQIADRLKEKLGDCREVRVIDIRLTSCTITDLIGIPTTNAERTETIWLRPEIYVNSEEEGVYYLYFFDELDKASPAVQAAALQLILDRKAWTHRFPEKTLVMAAANPARGMKDRETRMLPELMNRFRHFYVQPDFDSFREWALGQGVHPFVLGYLGFNPSRLYAEGEELEVAFPTPRSWKSVSDTLKAFLGNELREDQADEVKELFFDLAGEVGEGNAREFIAWCSIFRYLPDISDIFAGKPAPLKKKTPDILYALISAMTARVIDRAESISREELECACRYIGTLSGAKDYQTAFYANLSAIRNDGLRRKLLMIPGFTDWMRKNGEQA